MMPHEEPIDRNAELERMRRDAIHEEQRARDKAMRIPSFVRAEARLMVHEAHVTNDYDALGINGPAEYSDVVTFAASVLDDLRRLV